MATVAATCSCQPGHGQFFKAVASGDGGGDLFLYNPANGDWFRVTSEASGAFSYSAMGRWAAGWTVRTADFDGDGRTGLFLYDSASGRNVVAMNAADDFIYTGGPG